MLFEKTVSERISTIRHALEEERAMRQKVLGKSPDYMQRRVRQMDTCLADLQALEKILMEPRG